MSVIDRHIDELHAKERRFVCPLCKVSFFKQLEAMKKHIHKWHPGASVDGVQYELGYVQVRHTPPPQQPTATVTSAAANAAAAATSVNTSKRDSAPMTSLSASTDVNAPAGFTDLSANGGAAAVTQCSSGGLQVSDVKSLAVAETTDQHMDELSKITEGKPHPEAGAFED